MEKIHLMVQIRFHMSYCIYDATSFKILNELKPSLNVVTSWTSLNVVKQKFDHNEIERILQEGRN